MINYATNKGLIVFLQLSALVIKAMN